MGVEHASKFMTMRWMLNEKVSNVKSSVLCIPGEKRAAIAAIAAFPPHIFGLPLLKAIRRHSSTYSYESVKIPGYSSGKFPP